MRPLETLETEVICKEHKVSGGISSGQAMEYPDSGKEGQHQRGYPPQQQQHPRRESRQPQHQSLPYSSQEPSAQHYPQQQSLPQPQTYARNIYAQQDVTMSAAPQTMEHDYLSQQQQRQHHQQAQHAVAQQYLQHPGAYGTNSAYPSTASHTQQYVQQQQPALTYQQQLAMQQQQQQAPQPPFASAAGTGAMYHQSMEQSAVAAVAAHMPHSHHPHAHPQPQYLPKVGRLPADRPIIKLSVSLIDTYKQINTMYYEERDARRKAKEKGKKAHASGGSGQTGTGATNNGWDDENYDYILTEGELFYGRYRIKERIGKGSFGQVVRAEDTQENRDVAIKIIKSKKPFLMQAKTEIELLTHLNDKDPDDQHNIVRLLTHFMYRNHQCLVFEMLSLNLYELLKNTQFGGVSLNLIRKFAKQVLRSLSFLARSEVDIIHCDLKPENILLRHPKKSGIKVIDFGSSCRSNKRMYSYIQSRFYRSPEVMLGLPYAVPIDMWSLGCILAEMHTGEPLFSGTDQFDQMQKIVKLLGMVPSHMLNQSNDQHRLQFFERVRIGSTGKEEWAIKQQQDKSSSSNRAGGQPQKPAAVVVPSADPIASLTEVIRAETNRKKKYPPSETGNSPRNYELFVDLIYRMLSYDPRHRIKPGDALNHPFIAELK